MRLGRLLLSVPIAALVVAGCTGSSGPKASGVKLIDEDAGQFELVSPSGQLCIVDVTDPSLISRQAKASDVLLVTQGHHINQGYVDSFPGQKIVIKPGSLTAGDFRVTAVAAAHEPVDIDQANPTDVIYVVEVAGLRFAFFGEIGQYHLDVDQAKAIGRVDVLVSQLFNINSGMTAATENGITLVTQVDPNLFVPTYIDNGTAQIAASSWTGTWSESNRITLKAGALPPKVTFVLMGASNASYGPVLNLPKAKF